MANLLPCVFQGVGEGCLSLRSKYEIASVRDVFFSAHYWRLFEHLEQSPKLIVDLGAHCGHFAVLAHLAILEKFGVDSAQYILVEPLPALALKAARTLSDARISKQARIFQGLAGLRKGNAWIETPKNNLLGASIVSGTSKNKKGLRIDYLDLDRIVPIGGAIDILKVDVEGSEYDLMENYPDLFGRARLVFAELHGESDRQMFFENQLRKQGLESISKTIERGSERMVLFGRHMA
jgi:FkbM family methyltransferase